MKKLFWNIIRNKKTSPMFENILRHQLLLSVSKNVIKDLRLVLKETANKKHERFSYEKVGNKYLDFLSPDHKKDYRHELFFKINDLFSNREKLKNILGNKGNFEDFIDIESKPSLFSTFSFLDFYVLAWYHKDSNDYSLNTEYTLLLKSTRRACYDMKHLSCGLPDSMLEDFIQSIVGYELRFTPHGSIDFKNNILNEISYLQDQNSLNEDLCSSLGLEIPYETIPF